ncbi:MAG: glycosyltransferase family 39 protein [Flavobacteriales bacterium]
MQEASEPSLAESIQPAPRTNWIPRAGLLMMLCAFAVFKSSHLDLPYYWDEAWVYAPAITAMHDEGVSLMPWAIPPELSRGHPLFFHAVGAVWMNLFGDSFTAMHALPLFLTLLLVVATYRLGALLTDEATGFFAALLVCLSETVLAQSSLLLPEILLALLLVLSVTAYLQRKPWIFMISFTAALWTKETAIVAFVALLITHAWSFRDEHAWADRKAWRQWLLLIIAPVIVASSYFIVQRWSLGWFLFPEHVGMITWSKEDIAYKAREAFVMAFETEGVQWLTLTGTIAAPLLILRQRPVMAPLAAFCFTASIKILWGRWPVPSSLQLIAVAAAVATGIWLLARLARYQAPNTASPILLFGFCCVGLWAFSALNFYTPRYLLPIHPFLVIGTLAALKSTVLGSRSWVVPASSLAIAVVMMSSLGTDGHVGDTRLNYRDAISVHRDRIQYCTEKNLHDAHIMASFIDVHYMTHPESGYLQGSPVFTELATELHTDTEYAFVDYQSRKELPDELIAIGFKQVARFRKGQAWGDIYWRE